MTDAASPPSDPFASAKANLRDTVKWLATTFAALAAIVLAGASLTGVSQLDGNQRVAALTGGGIGLLCVIGASGIMLRLLTANTFFVSDLGVERYSRLKSFLNHHAIDFLPAQLLTVDDLLRERRRATEDVQRNDPTSQKYQDAAAFLEQLNPSLSRLTNLAQLEVLRRDLNSAVPWLLLLALGALGGLGVFATYSTPPKQNKPAAAVAAAPPPPAHGLPMNFDAGTNWSNIAKVLATKCKDKPPLKADILSSDRPNWYNIRLTAPKDCVGIVIPLPVDLAIPAAVAQEPET